MVATFGMWHPVPARSVHLAFRKDDSMKVGISFLLGLLLAFMVIFGYWLHTPHPLGTRSTALYRGLAQVDVIGDHATR
jgi:hypothetical protein